MDLGLLELLYPPTCVACGEVLEAPSLLCEPCELQVAPPPRPCCPRCAEPLFNGRSLCARCVARPPPFTETFAPFLHEGPIAKAIHRFKYEDHPELAPRLAALVLQRAAEGLDLREKPTLVAIPLHRRRLRTRGFDQAELLAREMAQRAQLPYLAEGLLRHRETRRQVGLSESAREENLAQAFTARPSVRGRTLLLVDDVFTTGATARAAATALLAAGAAKVRVLVLARAYGLD